MSPLVGIRAGEAHPARSTGKSRLSEDLLKEKGELTEGIRPVSRWSRSETDTRQHYCIQQVTSERKRA